MKTSLRPLYWFFALVVVVLLASGCATVNPGNKETGIPTTNITQAPPTIEATLLPSPQPVLTDEKLMNMEYLSPLLQATVKLVNGEYSNSTDGSEVSIKVLPGIRREDLNSDGIEDAAMLVAESTGGSGVFTSLIVVFSKNGQFQQAPGVMIDDRPVIDEMKIQDGVVKLSGLIHGPNDPMVSPTTKINAEYSLFGDRLWQTWLSAAPGGGAEHIIVIESPLNGDKVSGSFYLKGSMPIGPFENTLLLIIKDASGTELVHEAFMVQAPDMGTPATFENALQVPNVIPGTKLLVTLSELSMADGSLLAIDSVLLTVQ